jgi:hypothetical protein
MRKQPVAPRLAAHLQRGTPREPDGLRRLRRGEPGDASPSGSLPHGRYCLGFAVDCTRELSGRDETRVVDFYDATLPLLLAHRVARDSRQRWIDLIALLDELMDREGDLHASAAPWPLAEVIAVCGEAADLHASEPDGDPDHHALFTALHAALADHAACCEDVWINVHWW